MKTKIYFDSQDCSFNLNQKRKIKCWLTEVLKIENAQAEEIGFIFCSNQSITDINAKFLNHHFATDVITFPYHQSKEPIVGEVFIGIDVVKENAKTYQVTFNEELYRVMVHGVLHLVGYDDQSEEEKKQMQQKENFYLALQEKCFT